MAHLIQASLHLYALFIEVVYVFINISSSTPYVPKTCQFHEIRY